MNYNWTDFISLTVHHALNLKIGIEEKGQDLRHIFLNFSGQTEAKKHLNTVSAQLERRGSIFQKGFLGEVQFEFNIPGVLIKKVDKVKCFSIFYKKCLLFGIQESVPTL